MVFDQFANSGDMACILDLLSAGEVKYDNFIILNQLIALNNMNNFFRLRYHLLIPMHPFLQRILYQAIVAERLV